MAWGAITGTLTDQADLGTALAGKAATGHTHGQDDIDDLVLDLGNLAAGIAGKAAQPEVDDVVAEVAALTTVVGGKAAAVHTHAQADVTGLVGALAAREPANANIQAHIASAHAPATAQKNSDITKAEIEAKLVGEITSHTHAGGGGSPFVLEAFLAADVPTAANVTPVNLTGFVFNFLANSKYVLELFGVIQAPAVTTGVGIQVDVSAAVTLSTFTFFHQLANAGTLTGGSSIADDASVGLSSGVPTINVNVPVYGCGLLITGANAGTAQLRLRSEVAAIARMMANSILRVRKL